MIEVFQPSGLYGMVYHENISFKTSYNICRDLVTNSDSGSAQPDVEVSDPLDNAPWAALASLGLFKLFNDWESRGFNLPLKNPPNNVGDQMGGEAKKAKGNANGDFVMKPCKKMPEDPSTKHPVMLINEVYPGIAFECGNRGVDEMYSITVTINDQQFTGRGRSKKDAKKECAIAAAKALLNVEYSGE